MPKEFRIIFMALLVSITVACGDKETQQDTGTIPEPPAQSYWVRPTEGFKGDPCWGFRNGIQVGLHPLSGPRGLIRVYVPYTGQDKWKAYQFIAFEPTRKNGAKGFSEMEQSSLDNVQGKRFWSGNTADPTAFPNSEYPAAGVVYKENGLEKLSVYIFSEKFNNGVEVYARITFTEGKTEQFEMEMFHTSGSADVSIFVPSATMGNYARIRELYLKNDVRNSKSIWPNFSGDGFTDRNWTSLDGMIRDSRSGAWYIAAQDEANPAAAEYASSTYGGWIYKGIPATQYWYCANPHGTLRGAANGRWCYWASNGNAPIPGGISFENFELQQNYQRGQTFVFGITLKTPEQLIEMIKTNQL